MPLPFGQFCSFCQKIPLFFGQNRQNGQNEFLNRSEGKSSGEPPEATPEPGALPNPLENACTLRLARDDQRRT